MPIATPPPLILLISLVQADRAKQQKNRANRAKSMNFCMKVPKTKEKILIRRASKNYIV